MESVLPLHETSEVKLALEFRLCLRNHELVSSIARTVVEAANEIHAEARTRFNRTTLHTLSGGSLIHLSH